VSDVPSARPSPTARWCWYALLVALAAWGAALGMNPRRAGDLHIYLTAAQRFWRGVELYPQADAAWPFKYAPAAASLFLPLSVLPARAAAAAWNVGSIAAFGFAAAQWRVALRDDPRFRTGAWTGIAATVALAQSFFLELFYGQVDLLMLALLVWPFTPAGRRHQVWSGVCLAAAVLLKPTAIVVLAAPIILRRHRMLLGVIAGGVAMHVPLILRFGWPGAVAQMSAWTATLDRTTAPWVLGYNPQGLPTLLLSAVYSVDGIPSRAALAIANVASIATVLGAAMWVRSSVPTVVAVLCFGAAFASPLAWRANFVLAWPLVAALLSLRGAPGRRTVVVAAVGAVAAVEWLVAESVLGPERARAVLAARPWAIAFLILTAVALWVFPKGQGVSEAAPAAPR
jgi:hypothetical protein